MRILVTLLCLGTSLFGAEGPQLFQQPAINKTHIVFVFAGDLWQVGRGGGEAVRLTTGKGSERDPAFSADGSMVAFTGEYDGNVDVFVVAASGGIPKRITSHPGNDTVVGWTPDSKRILFASGRENLNPGVTRLYTVSMDGGLPEALPFPTAAGGAYSPDGTQIAYLPLARADQAWKRYRGGRATPIWIAKLSDSSWTPIPRRDANDYNPMWVGNTVYLLSDRSGKVTLFKYDTKSKQVSPLFENRGLDLKWASATTDAIVYEQFGSIHLFDLKTNKSAPVNITLNGDLGEVRPRMEKLSRFIQNPSISPTGVRVAFEARGEIFTVPAEKGNVRNVSKTPGAAERSPAWSPDGKWIAYFSDESGEYAIHISPQNGMGDVKKISLGPKPTYYYSLDWSPDSKKLSYTDKALNLWYVDAEKGAPVKVDTGSYMGANFYFDPVWSPDSKWLAYAKQMKNHLCTVHLYSLETSKATRITDGMGDARSPVFDRNGKYLYLTVSTDSGPTVGSIDMSTMIHPASYSVYVAVLSKDEASPLAPESDEEKAAEEKKDEKKPDAAKVAVKIDLENIQQRTIPLPIPPRNYVGLDVGKTGILFVVEAPASRVAMNGPVVLTAHRFDLSKRKMEKFADGVRSLRVSANGEKVVLGQPQQSWIIAGTGAAPKPGEGRLKVDEIEALIDPVAEWRQMYKEVLRLERDFFYDPGLHGVDVQALGERYEKYLRALGSRADLNYLWREMLGELSVGHLYVMGGDAPQPNRVRGGLLGADYKVENGRYRISRIYSGENWNPQTRAPLTQPGVNVATGEYILAVNGKELKGSDEIYALLEGTAGKTVTLRVSADASGSSAREVSVIPLDSEAGLRQLAWMEDNRKKVDQLTGGKAAYVYLPDTYINGYTYFNRYYFAQADRQALVIDERFNGGGLGADYMIDYLRRPVWNYWTTRDGDINQSPSMNITGPKAMIINEWAGSGGDALPWYFRRAKLGTLVGKRTWGGLVGIGGTPSLIDGGFVTAPNFAFWTPEGKWEVENYGTPADVEVDLDPKAWREGRDTQLEKAVEVVMEQLRKMPPAAMPKQPAFPNYHQPGTSGGR